jgi:hypothetical protein
MLLDSFWSVAAELPTPQNPSRNRSSWLFIRQRTHGDRTGTKLTPLALLYLGKDTIPDCWVQKSPA